MKITHALPLVFLMSFFAFSTQSQEYKAPSFKWKKRDVPQVKVVKEGDFKEFGENSYKVQEVPTSIRDVASEEEENEEYSEEADGRNPSSATKPEPFRPQLKPWPYK